MAHDSRPAGFEMVYWPVRLRAFGPPARAWIPGAAYLATALSFALFVAAGHLASTDSWIFRYVVEGDAQRMLGAKTVALVVLASAVAALARTAMRGVLLHSEGIEARASVAFGWPNVSSCGWVEIQQIVLERGAVGLRLWDGRTCWLPRVADPGSLTTALGRIAATRAIPVTGDVPRRERLRWSADESGPHMALSGC
jgi:hypothetical protein